MIAAAQHGQIAHRQLVALGFSRRAIAHRVAAGRLHPRFRGVYSVGHRVITERGWWMAAVLAAGVGAVLSHRAAAALWGIGRARQRIEVTVPRDRRIAGLTRFVTGLAEDERTVVDGIPVTTVARTILDLAAVAPRHEVEKALREAEVRQLGDRTPLTALLERHRGRRGTRVVRGLLGRATLGRTRSELEEAFLRYLDRHHLPRPLLNVGVEGFEVDCFWPAARLVVELDGRRFHEGDHRFATDRRRDRILAVTGYRTVRVTDEQLDDAELARDLRTLTTL